MFIICFGDGLGNQMFQYAFYKAMVKAYPENNVTMDIFRIYGNYIHNGFELDRIFGIEVKNAPLSTTLKLADFCPKTKITFRLMNCLHNLRRYILGPKDTYITQDDATGYYEGVFHLSDIKSYVLRGNWVNEKYFKEIKEEIVHDFTFPPFQEKHNIAMFNRMKQCEAVSVHIRKGDYLSSDMFNLSVKYYSMAKQIIEKQVNQPSYFIFTDDKDAIKEYLKLFPEFTLIEGNFGENSFRDMQLMSSCKHNIIANSTFSFWGAYLNQNANKIVVAPDKAKQGFRNPFACEDWYVIPYTGEKD